MKTCSWLKIVFLFGYEKKVWYALTEDDRSGDGNVLEIIQKDFTKVFSILMTLIVYYIFHYICNNKLWGILQILPWEINLLIINYSHDTNMIFSSYTITSCKLGWIGPLE